MFKTPNLDEFLVTWFLQPSQFPNGVTVGNEEFLAERFIEDIMDGKQSIALVIQEVQLPIELTEKLGDVPVRFKVLTTKDMARELIELGYKVNDRDESDGMTWSDLLSMVNGHMRPMGEELESPIRLTDDNDPHSPWFQMMGLKKDDDGWFIAIEEIDL